MMSLPYRKICRNCKCGLEDHDVQMGSEERKKVGKLFEDTKYTGLIAKLKKDVLPPAPGNTGPLPTDAAVKKDAAPLLKVATYEWAPPVANPSLVMFTLTSLGAICLGGGHKKAIFHTEEPASSLANDVF